VTASSLAGTLTNAGTILATGLAGTGVPFNAGGVVMDGGASGLENKSTVAGGTDAVRLLGTLARFQADRHQPSARRGLASPANGGRGRGAERRG